MSTHDRPKRSRFAKGADNAGDESVAAEAAKASLDLDIAQLQVRPHKNSPATAVHRCCSQVLYPDMRAYNVSLQGMGFSSSKAHEALQDNHHDLAAAIEWLIANCV